MSGNNAYFTTSPAMLMKRWQALNVSPSVTPSISVTPSNTPEPVPTGIPGSPSVTPSVTPTVTPSVTPSCSTYTISVYATSNSDCVLNSTCGFACLNSDVLTLEYSTDNGTNWNSTGIDLSYADKNCLFQGDFIINGCETSLIFRIMSLNCGARVYFEYTDNSSNCPAGGACGNCTILETNDLMPTSNKDIAFHICTQCDGSCCVPCCE